MQNAFTVFNHIVENYNNMSELQFEKQLEKLDRYSTAMLLHAANRNYSKQEYLQALIHPSRGHSH